MKAGEAITRLLADYGVSCVFGIPGTHTLELYRGLENRKYGVDHFLAHHEQGAGFMADGYARVTGRPGVCFVITGAGVTNIATPLGEAFSDSVPLLVVSPVNPPDGGGHNQGRLHEITDQAAVTAPLTAFSATAQSVDEIPNLIARAFAVFSSERPRPVHISVPLPLLNETVQASWRPSDLPDRPVASSGKIEQAREYIEQASRAVIIAGGGTRFCSDAVVRLAEVIGCPVITTVAGRGVMPAGHGLSTGAQLRAAPVQELLGESDLAILLGTELGHTDHWNEALPMPDRQVRINVEGPTLVTTGDVVAIRADVGDAVDRLRSRLSVENKELNTSNSLKRCSMLKNSLINGMTAKEQRHMQVLDVLLAHLPHDARVFSDMTQLAYTAIDFMPLQRPNSWHHPIGFGTLGYALPAAIGGAIADPSSAVVVIVGDAGLQYTMQELPLAAELGLDIKILLWNNDRLEQIREDMVAAGIAPTGVCQRNPDFKLLAEACGWRYDAADSLERLDSVLARAFAEDGPFLAQVNENNIFTVSA